MNTGWKTMRKNWKLFSVLMLLGLSACGKTTFDKQQFSASASANQYITIKPKVDIVMFQDISASMLVPMQQLTPQLNSFIASLDQSWDFHFAVLPLQYADNLNNRYIIAQNCAGIANCLLPSQSSYFSAGSGWYNASSSYGSVDDSFATMQANLSNSNSMVSSGFLRSDAMLVVIPFTNGNDITGMSYPSDYFDRGDGKMVPNYNGANAVNSYNNFKSYFLNSLKPSVSLVSLYSVAAGNASQNPDSQIPCLGGSAWPGTRYLQMALDVDNAFAGYINGGDFDICSNQLSSVLSAISTRMQNTILAVQFNYVVLPDRPVPSSLTIYKNGVALPANNSTNGWTLANVVNGTQQYTSNQATSFAPYPGNNQSGYFVQLHGSAIFSGADSITFTYDKF